MTDTITLPREVAELIENLMHHAYNDGVEQLKYRSSKTVEAEEALRTALAAEQPKHPGYVIGSHWLETSYGRICAGEAEADVLRDIGLVREEAFLTGVAHLKTENEALRRDAFRKGFYAGFAATGEGWNGEYPFQDKNRPIAGDPSIEAAIDAAMKEDKT